MPTLICVTPDLETLNYETALNESCGPNDGYEPNSDSCWPD